MTTSFRRTASSIRTALAAVALALSSTCYVFAAPGADLAEMVHRPDGAYRWQIQTSTPRAIDVDLISQHWRQSAWRHAMQIVRPVSDRHPDLAVLIVGGDAHREFVDEQTLADTAGVVVARLDNVPNQPLYGQQEDALVAYTFEQFLRTGDFDWPLLVPMTRSAVKAMDALRDIAAKEWQLPIRRFVITGASKRGWTSWLAGAADPRVAGIVPVVFDNLNFAAQMKNQHAVWNGYSPQIGDYTERALPMLTETEGGRKLLAVVDPYSHLAPLARVAKLIINGANDPYWELGAIDFYWKDLRGPKSLLEIPNAGHGAGGDARVGPTIAAFVDRVGDEKPMPELRWSGSDRTASLVSDEEPTSATIWTADSASRDFRGARWRPIDTHRDGHRYTAKGALAGPSGGRFVAIFGEAVYAAATGPFRLSTPVRIFPPSAPADRAP